MARLGGMSTESFSSARDRALSAASVGLVAILRDQKTIPVTSIRSNVSLGLSTQTPSSAASRSLSNSPVRSLATSPTESSGFLDAADDPDDHKEEDMPTDSRNPPSLKDHLGLTNAASSHGFDVRNHGYDPPFRHGFSHAHSHTSTHAYNQQLRHSCTMHHDGPKQQMYAIDAARPARHHMADKSVGIRDAITTNAMPTVRLSPLSKGSDSQSSHGPTGRALTPSWTIPCAGRRTSHDATRHSEHQSAPVNMPNWSKMLTREGNAASGSNGIIKVDEDDSERLPPHEMLARQYAQCQTMTSSVCEGQGRTLKGRDMRRVRNAVWRQSGFAD